MKEIKLYWSRGKSSEYKNFGDWLSPLLCEALSGRRVVYAKPSKCDLMAIGSVLQKAKTGWWRRPIDVWGTGLISDVAQFNSPHRFHAVRGKLTANKIKNRSVKIYGDPGLLCKILLPREGKSKFKKYRLGIIPHYVDRNNVTIKRLNDKIKNSIMIDVYSEAVNFIEKVSQCEVVLSSSLHGLITADALGVPNSWIVLSNNITGDNFKFHDYYSAFNLFEEKPFDIREEIYDDDIMSIIDLYSRPNIDDVCEDLIGTFPYGK